MNFKKYKLIDLVDNFSVRARDYGGSDGLEFLGVSNDDGIVKSKSAAEHKGEEYKIIEKGCFAYNPYRINIGSIAYNNKDIKGLISPAYVIFKTKPNSIKDNLLFKFLKSAEGLRQIRFHGRGTVRQALRFEDLCKIEISLPSYEEQESLISNIEKTEFESNLISSELTHQLDLIKQLRQAFLREAMQGKLVGSSELGVGSETGHELLAKIKAEKAQLIAEKKLKKVKELSPITADEIPFEIPEHWAWCRLGEISNIQRGSSPRPKGDSRYFAKSQTSYNWITISDISSFCEGNKLKQTKEHLTEEGSKHSRFVDVNEFIIAVSGSTTGKCCLTEIDGYIYDGLAVVKQINSNLPSEFLMNYMTYLYAHINNSKSGASFPNINTDFLNNLIYPLPPLHEQEQIVSKLEELMAFCDGLEQSIKESQGYNEKLLQQVLREALQPKEEFIN